MSRLRILGYGTLGLPLAFGALPLYVYVPDLYVRATTLSLASIGAILLMARLADAVADPWLGWLADRMPRRRLVALALPVFATGFWLLLHPPVEPAGPWLLGSLLLCFAGYSAASIAYQAWGAQVGADPQARTRLTAAREGFGLAGVVLAATLPMAWASESAAQVQPLAWLLPPLLGLALLAAWGSAAGKAAGASAGVQSESSLWMSLRGVMADPHFARLLVVFVANGISAALPATLFLFFVADVIRTPTHGGALLALYFIAGAASLPLWVRAAGTFGRVRAWQGGMVLALAAFASAGALGEGDVLAFALICAASGLALGADLALPAAMAADRGERLGQSGACFGVWNLVTKLNLALAAGLALPLLALAGYTPGGSEGLGALTLAYAGLPLAFKVFALGLLRRWTPLLENQT